MDEITGWLIVTLLIVTVVFVYRRIFGMHKQGLGYSEEAVEGMRKRLAMDEELLALHKGQLSQGAEILEVLKAIQLQLENRR